MSASTGLSRTTVSKGVQELKKINPLPPDRIRKEGGGRKKSEVLDSSLKDDLLHLVDPNTRGDPQSSLRWTNKSLTNLTEALRNMENTHDVSVYVVRRLLR